MWLPPSLQLPLQSVCIALSFNGRTSDSDSLDRGSNPWGATKRNKSLRTKEINFPNVDSNRASRHPKILVKVQGFGSFRIVISIDCAIFSGIKEVHRDP